MSKFLIHNSLGVNKKDLQKRRSLIADDETRTRDSLLGRQILYQLSYVRITLLNNFKIKLKNFQV